MELIKYLPEFMRKVDCMRKITNAEQPEFDELNIGIDNIQKEMFIETASEIGVERFENIYGIENIGREDIDFRKYRLMLKIMGSEHVSLSERLDKLIGTGNYTINFYSDDMRLQVRITVENKRYVQETFELLDRIIPCNIVLDVGVLYASHKMLGKYTHGELAAYKYSELKLIDI